MLDSPVPGMEAPPRQEPLPAEPIQLRALLPVALMWQGHAKWDPCRERGTKAQRGGVFPKNTDKKPESLAFSDQSFLETKDSADRKLAIRHGTVKN